MVPVSRAPIWCRKGKICLRAVGIEDAGLTMVEERSVLNFGIMRKRKREECLLHPLSFSRFTVICNYYCN